MSLCSVYTVDPVQDTSKAKIKYLDSVQFNLVKDTLIEQYKLKQFQVDIFTCNIADKYIISTKKLPVLAFNVSYSQSIKQIKLFTIYLFFTIESEILTKKQFLHDEISGKYSIEMLVNDSIKELKVIETILDINTVVDNIKTLLEKEEMVDLMQSVFIEESKKLEKFYETEMQYYQIPQRTIDLNDYKR